MTLDRWRIISFCKDLMLSHQSHRRLFRRCSSSSQVLIPFPLVRKLLDEPNSRLKAILDLEESNSTFRSLDFSWDSFLTALSSSSLPKAQLVMEWRLEKLLKEKETNHGFFCELIHLCGKMQTIPMAWRVFTSMEAQGLKPTSSIFNALISACLSSGNVVKALSLFEMMENSEAYKPNSETYNAFISAFSKLGNDVVVEAWYSAKISAEFPADLQTYESLIFGCVKSKNFHAADVYFKEMVMAGVVPNVAILQNMLVGYCEGKSVSKVEEFLKFILDGGWEIDKYMIERLLALYRELGKVEPMEELLLTLTKSNQVPEVLALVHRAIIRVYAMSDRLDDVEYSDKRMLKQGILFGCPGDVENVICSYFRRADYANLDIFLERIKGSYKFTWSTYELLFSGYQRAGLTDKVNAMMNEVKIDGFL